MKKSINFFLLSCCLVLAACTTPTHKNTAIATVPTTNVTQEANEPEESDTTTLPTPSVSVSTEKVQNSPLLSSPLVRVLLAEEQKKIQIKSTGRVNIYTKNLDKKFKISNPVTIDITILSSGTLQVGTLKTTQPVFIEPVGETILTFNKNSYVGKFYILPQKNSFSVIEYTSLENYLYGVLPYEMSYSWPVEALKAQAVAARTYTLKTMETTKSKNFDVYSDVRSQMYKGAGKKYDSVRDAVDGTKNQVLVYNDKLFYTYYHANCGGATDDVRSWNSSATSIKPLSGASCKYDTHSKSYSWNMKVPTSKVTSFNKSIGLLGTLKGIKISNKTSTGRATNLTITTKNGSKKVACGKFRLATGIKSCKISKITVKTSEILFEGKGYGHGIGMCQDGANGMAKAGKDYKQILKNYYPSAVIMELK